MKGSGSKRGERVLESRHLIGLFLGVVLLCCVFFTLGYVLGKTQYANSPVEAAAPPKTPAKAEAAQKPPEQQPPSSAEWDFYTSKKPADIPLVPAKPAEGVPGSHQLRAMRSAAEKREKASAERRERDSMARRYRAPRIPRGAIVLQVAALRSESDALALTDALQRKGFPAFVLTTTTDRLYRVQVGPFATQSTGEKAKRSLEREGFKSIYKR